jgi:hypothetical protein
VFRPSVSHRKLTRRPAAYTPGTARPICPSCWSRPDLKWGREGVLGASAPRGWAVTQAAEPALVDGVAVPVTVAIYRCANPACATAVELAVLATAGYVPDFVRQHQLAGADAASFAAGRHTGAGVWVDAAGEPKTAPAQRELF